MKYCFLVNKREEGLSDWWDTIFFTYIVMKTPSVPHQIQRGTLALCRSPRSPALNRLVRETQREKEIKRGKGERRGKLLPTSLKMNEKRRVHMSFSVYPVIIYPALTPAHMKNAVNSEAV